MWIAREKAAWLNGSHMYGLNYYEPPWTDAPLQLVNAEADEWDRLTLDLEQDSRWL